MKTEICGGTDTKLTRELLAVGLAGLVLFGPALWNRDLWSPLETLYGEVAREIVSSGDWLTLHQNGVGYFNKPPVHFWLMAGAMKAIGVTTAAARLPSVLAGTGCLLLCYLTARKLGINPLISSLVLATSWEFFTAAQRATLDVTLTFFILLSFYLYLISDESPRGWLCFLGAGVAAGLAVLTKGPVALLVLACAIFPYLLARRQWREIFHWKWIAMLAVTAAIGLAWFIPACNHQEQLYNELVNGQVLSRMGSGWKRSGPFYFYLANFPPMFLPWFVYFPLAAVHLWKRRTERSFHAFLWFAVGFVAFSCFPPKWSRYIIPLYPAASMMVGAYLSTKDSWAGLLSLAAFPVLAVGGAAVVGIKSGAPLCGFGFGVPVLIISIAGLLLWRKLGYRALGAVAFASLFIFSITLYPWDNTRRSPRPTALYLKAMNAKPGDIAWYPTVDPGVAFYLQYAPMREMDSAQSVAGRPETWIVTEDDDAREEPEAFAKLKLAKSFPFHRRRLLVFRNDGQGVPGETGAPE